MTNTSAKARYTQLHENNLSLEPVLKELVYELIEHPWYTLISNSAQILILLKACVFLSTFWTSSLCTASSFYTWRDVLHEIRS